LRKDIIKDWADKNEIIINDKQFELLKAFQREVLQVNEVMNLTSITDDAEFAVKHIIDSMTLLPFIKTGVSLIDVGTGAGFPGVVLRIMRDDIHVTLLDSRQKRIRFLDETLKKLEITNVELVAERAEDFAKTGIRFDVCCARAVAPLKKLIPYTLPLLESGGTLLAMKGFDVQNEVNEAEKILKKYDAKVKEVSAVKISNDIKHTVIEIGRNILQ